MESTIEQTDFVQEAVDNFLNNVSPVLFQPHDGANFAAAKLKRWYEVVGTNTLSGAYDEAGNYRCVCTPK